MCNTVSLSSSADNGINIELTQKQKQIQNFAKKYKIEIADDKLKNEQLVDIIVKFIALNEYQPEQNEKQTNQSNNKESQGMFDRISNFFRKFQHESVFSKAFNALLNKVETDLGSRRSR